MDQPKTKSSARTFSAIAVALLVATVAATAFAQPSPLSSDDIRRVEDALSWPLIAEQLRSEGGEEATIAGLIDLGRRNYGHGLNSGLLLEAVHEGTIESGPMAQTTAVVSAIIETGPRGHELREAIRRAHRDAARREGSGEALDGSGIGALAELETDREERGVGPGPGLAQHGDDCAHHEDHEQRGTGSRFMHHEPGAGDQTDPHGQEPAQWRPGTGEGRPQYTHEDVVILDRPRGEPGTQPAHPAPGEVNLDEAWIPGSGRGGRPGTEGPPEPSNAGGEPAGWQPGAGRPVDGPHGEGGH